MSWEKVKLGDIAICIQPGPFGSQLHNSDYSESGTPIIMPKDMIDGKISHSNLIFVGEEHTKRLCRHQVHAGNLMVARKGDVRKCVFITENEDGWMTGSDCLKVALKENVCYPRFIYYQLRSPFIGRWLEKISIGATMPSINTGLLSGIELALPSLKEQKRIADILSAYDNLIENNQKQIKLLEEAAQRLYKQWFIDLRYPGHETTPIVDGLPQGWRKEKFGDVVDYVRGTSYTSNELSETKGALMVNLKNINAFGGYKRNAEKRFTGKYKENGILESGDLVMGCTDMTKERRLVGHVALIPNLREPAIFTMDLLKLLPKKLSKNFIYAQCRFGGLSYKISPLANGANVLHLRPENMADIEVLCPDENHVHQYDVIFESMISKINKLEDQIQLAAESHDRLLPKLMNGIVFFLIKIIGDEMTAIKLNNEQKGLIKMVEASASDKGVNADDYFEFFVPQQILKRYNLSDEEIESGVCGGGNDGACDSIYIFLNDELLNSEKTENILSLRNNAYKNAELEIDIFQTKNSPKQGFSETGLSKWKDTLSDLLLSDNPENTDLYKETIIGKFSEFKQLSEFLFGNARIVINFYYVTLTTEKVHTKVTTKANSIKKAIQNVYGTAVVNFEFVGANALYKYFLEKVNADSYLKFTESFSNENNYVILTKLSDYYDFLLDEKKQLRKDLFDANVRDYQGHNETNVEIGNTLSSEKKEDFWIFNNGVTILVSEDVATTSKTVKLVGPSIVNGLQTSREVYNYFTSNPAALKKEKRSILIRIIKPKNDDLRLKIIKSTNNQTNIPKVFLRSTDKIHLDIETYFFAKKLYYDRRKNYYKNQGKTASEIISVPFLAQCLISVVFAKPDYARARPSTILQNDNYYNGLYNESYNIESYYKIAYIGKTVRDYLSGLPNTDKGNICLFVVYVLAAKLLGKKDISFDDLDSLNLSNITEDLLEQSQNLVYDLYKELGATDSIVKNSEFTQKIRGLL